MERKLQQYVQYTTEELESYAQAPDSCVEKVNTNLHLALGPHCLADFKSRLISHIVRQKAGNYDRRMDGIVLDIKNVKVFGKSAAIRVDDPRIHVNVNADCYVFRPVEGVVLSGVVKHIGGHHVGVLIYRVFSVSIRLNIKLNNEDVRMNEEVKFRIKNFHIQNAFPYIEGELLMQPPMISPPKSAKKTKFNVESKENGNDSGLEESELQELDELITLIKEELVSESDTTLNSSSDLDKSDKAERKRKRKSNSISSDALTATVKREVSKSPKKRKLKTEIQSKDC